MRRAAAKVSTLVAEEVETTRRLTVEFTDGLAGDDAGAGANGEVVRIDGGLHLDCGATARARA